MKRRLRIITYAWGVDYVRRLLDVTLAAVLAPGNLPALAEVFACEFVLLTEQGLFGLVEASPTYRRISMLATARLVAMDDLLAAPLYGMTLTWATYRAMADLGDAVVETDFLFFTADWVPADDSYRSLIPHLQKGERLIVAPSYCAVTEEVLPILRARVDAATNALVMTKREMAAMIIASRHNTIRGKTINTHLFHMDVIEQFYWFVDRSTMLAHQMPIAIVCMRPERFAPVPSSFWDYGTVSELCPNVKPCVLADSDEFLMLELRNEATHDDGLRLGWPSDEAIGRTLAGFVTKDHVEYGRHQLVLHAEDLPPETKAASEQLYGFVRNIYKFFEDAEAQYVDHPYWKSQSTLFAIARRYARFPANSAAWQFSQYSRFLTSVIGAELAAYQEEAEAAWIICQDSSTPDAVSVANKLRLRLDRIEQAIKVMHAVYRRDTVLACRDVEEERISVGEHEEEAKYLSERAAGREPALTRFSRDGAIPLRNKPIGKADPRWAPLRFVQRVVTKASLPADAAVLQVTSASLSAAARVPVSAGRSGVFVSALTAAHLEREDFEKTDKFDLCVVELDRADILKLRRIYDRVRPVMRSGGTFVAYFYNEQLNALAAEPVFIRKVFPRCDFGRVWFAGSHGNAAVIRFHRRLVRLLERFLGSATSAFIARLLVALPACAANVGEVLWSDPAMPHPRFTTSLTIEVDT